MLRKIAEKFGQIFHRHGIVRYGSKFAVARCRFGFLEYVDVLDIKLRKIIFYWNSPEYVSKHCLVDTLEEAKIVLAAYKNIENIKKGKQKVEWIE